MTAANDIVRSCRHQKATDKVGGSLLKLWFSVREKYERLFLLLSTFGDYLFHK